MKLDVRNMSGAVVDSVEALDDVFDAPMNAALVHQVMVGQLANKRQGTAKVKTRSEVAGGGAKPRPQKYTGRSRQGSIRSPQWRGGGIVFGPTPRSYRQRTPKRMKRQAVKVVLSDKAREQNLVVVDDFTLDDGKTKRLMQALTALQVDSSALLVGDEMNANVVRAVRNIPKVRTLPVDLLNTVDLLNAGKVVMTVGAVRKAERIWGGDFVRIGRPAMVVEDAAGDDAVAVVDDVAGDGAVAVVVDDDAAGDDAVATVVEDAAGDDAVATVVEDAAGDDAAAAVVDDAAGDDAATAVVDDAAGDDAAETDAAEERV